MSSRLARWSFLGCLLVTLTATVRADVPGQPRPRPPQPAVDEPSGPVASSDGTVSVTAPLKVVHESRGPLRITIPKSLLPAASTEAVRDGSVPVQQGSLVLPSEWSDGGAAEPRATVTAGIALALALSGLGLVAARRSRGMTVAGLVLLAGAIFTAGTALADIRVPEERREPIDFDSVHLIFTDDADGAVVINAGYDWTVQPGRR